MFPALTSLGFLSCCGKLSEVWGTLATMLRRGDSVPHRVFFLFSNSRCPVRQPFVRWSGQVSPCHPSAPLPDSETRAQHSKAGDGFIFQHRLKKVDRLFGETPEDLTTRQTSKNNHTDLVCFEIPSSLLPQWTLGTRGEQKTDEKKKRPGELFCKISGAKYLATWVLNILIMKQHSKPWLSLLK